MRVWYSTLYGHQNAPRAGCRLPGRLLGRGWGEAAAEEPPPSRRGPEGPGCERGSPGSGCAPGCGGAPRVPSSRRRARVWAPAFPGKGGGRKQPTPERASGGGQSRLTPQQRGERRRRWPRAARGGGCCRGRCSGAGGGRRRARSRTGAAVPRGAFRSLPGPGRLRAARRAPPVPGSARRGRARTAPPAGRDPRHGAGRHRRGAQHREAAAAAPPAPSRPRDPCRRQPAAATAGTAQPDLPGCRSPVLPAGCRCPRRHREPSGRGAAREGGSSPAAERPGGGGEATEGTETYPQPSGCRGGRSW